MPGTLYNRAGFSYANNVALTTTLTAFACTADTANSPESYAFPHNCNIQSVEIYIASGIDGAGYTVQMYLTRDSGGLVPITPGVTSGATQTITYTTGTTGGGVVFNVDNDFHFDSGVTNATNGTIYVVAKISTEAASEPADIRVNWRA